MKKYYHLIILLCCSTFGAAQTISGKITDEAGIPLADANIIATPGNFKTQSNHFGDFIVQSPADTGTLRISFVGYQSETVHFTPETHALTIRLRAETGTINEVQVIGYGSTTKRLNTGSVATLTSADIEKQPITNVLSALSGRMAGVYVQTANGLPGGNVTIQVRGTGSITAGNNPLYIIDGVPFSATVGTLDANSTLSAGAISGVISPLNSINPSDIASISILKDADATAIYGSRGANGVVLITTKKGKAGKTKVSASVEEGLTQAANIPRLLTIAQYKAIRNAAYANAGETPSGDPNSDNYAPDLTTWGGQNTNWAKYFLGGTGKVNNDQLTVSGGNTNTNFTVSSNYHSEKNYLPGDNFYDRGGVHTSLQHTSANGKFYLQFANSLTLDHNLMANPAADIAYLIMLAPNYPVDDPYGNYNWYSGANPAAESLATAETSTDNLVTDLLLRYTVIKDLAMKISAGYNKINVNQTQINPDASLYPGSTNYTNFGKNDNQSFIIEPQLTYDLQFQGSTLNLLAGGTYQNSTSQGETLTGYGFSSEELMNDLASASYYTLGNNYTQYKYVSVFGRATYDIAEKYIVNATIRRDGSSRFGPDEQFGNFWSVGGAWIWSDEKLIKKELPFLSFGKLRSSYGLTGNDQIADYQYLSAYGNSYTPYQGIAGLAPARIANPDFHWEATKKFDAALDLGFFKNRILLNIDYYRELTNDQLVAYNIPSITGFTSYEANLPAVVQNTGWEFELNTKNMQKDNFSWSTTLNLTLPRNELKSFPGLASSSYANTLVVGQDITRVYGYNFVGLDNSGSSLYQSVSGTPTHTPNSATDGYYTLGKKTPVLYGGVGNTLTYKSFSLDIFGQFANQSAFGNIIYTPGSRGNGYIIYENRWTAADTHTRIPAASMRNDFYYHLSSANYFNASYFRVKNIALSYELPKAVLQALKMDNGRIYFQAQNLLTFWNSKIPMIDPETGPLTGGAADSLPPSKTFVLGIQTTF